MLIDLTCPAELFRTDLPTEEHPAASLTLFNLGDRVIVSAEVLLRLLDEDGAEAERLTYRGRGLNGRPHSTFELTVPCAPAENLRAIDATVEKVWYTDGDVWRRDPANAVEYTPNVLPVCRALTRLKYVAGETAVGYPSLQENLWVCVCGRPNPAGADFCARCGQQREFIFSRYTPEAVEAQVTLKERQLDLSSRSMREDTIRMQRIREEEYRKRKDRGRGRLRVAGGLLAAALLTAGAYVYGAPALRLWAARRDLAAGNYETARATFALLGSFADAEEGAAECDWRLALAAAESADSAESLRNASELLRAVTGREEAREKADETDLLLARLLLGQGNWEEALTALDRIPEDTPGREELEKEGRMAQALSLKAAGAYEEARTLFLALENWPGAAEQASACLYEPALACMADGDWDGAIDLLSGIQDYLSSREKTLECHYHKAEELLEAGDRDGASREFLMAGDYSDAADRSRLLIYDEAAERAEAGDLQGAQALYAAIPDFLDANERGRRCRYLLAEAAASDREFTLALEYLKDIPDDYEETAALRAEASYEKARLAVRREDWLTAAELLRDLDRASLRRRYRDVETIYLQACEKAGIEPYPETPEPVPETEAESDPEPTVAREEERATPEPAPFLVTEEETP